MKSVETEDEFSQSHESPGYKFNNRPDPDAYKEDWIDSIVFKKAMKAEAIKRGLHVDSEFEIDDEDERVAMTATVADGASCGGFDG